MTSSNGQLAAPKLYHKDNINIDAIDLQRIHLSKCLAYRPSQHRVVSWRTWLSGTCIIKVYGIPSARWTRPTKLLSNFAALPLALWQAKYGSGISPSAAKRPLGCTPTRVKTGLPICTLRDMQVPRADHTLLEEHQSLTKLLHHS
jgi:hypothetical protein